MLKILCIYNTVYMLARTTLISLHDIPRWLLHCTARPTCKYALSTTYSLTCT